MPIFWRVLSLFKGSELERRILNRICDSMHVRNHIWHFHGSPEVPTSIGPTPRRRLLILPVCLGEIVRTHWQPVKLTFHAATCPRAIGPHPRTGITHDRRLIPRSLSS
jgi:hypothetical protein